MKEGRYGLAIKKTDFKTKFLFVIQLIVVISLFNSIIASYNGRYMLYKPYEKMFENGGYFFSMTNSIANDDEHITKSFDKLKGDYTFFTFPGLTPRINEEENVRLLIIDDEFYNKLRLPLKSGKYSSNADFYGIISCNNMFHTNDTVPLYDFDLNISVCGELTNPTYFPTLNSYTANGDVRMFYSKYSIELDLLPFILVPMSSYVKMCEKVGEIAWLELGGIIYYNSPPSDIEHKNNLQVLSQEQIIVDLIEVNDRTIKYLNEDVNKYMPISILALIVSVIGIVCSTAIYSIKQIKTYTVYYLCGMQWQDALNLIAVNVILMLTISLGIVIAAGVIFNILGLFSNFGFVIRFNNLAITFAIVFCVFVIAMIFPAVFLRKQSPVDLLRRNRE